MKLNRIFAGLIACAVMGVSLPCAPYANVTMVSASEEAVTASGQCGENLTWTLDEEGVFTVSGIGNMVDASLPLDTEWNDYKEYIKTIIIEEGVTSVGRNAFNGCISLTEVHLPSTLISLNGSSFAGCYELTSITLPQNLTNIGGSVFDSTPLTEINVSDDNLYFSSVNGVLFNKDMTRIIRYPEGKSETSYTIPASVIEIEPMTFYNCRSLEVFEVEENSEYLSGVDGVVFSSDLTKLICYPMGKSDREYTVPDGVEVIEAYAFTRCFSLNEVVLPETVTSIEKSAFSSCQCLTKINFPQGLTSIGNYAFMSCTSLLEVTIPENISSIGDFTFYACRSLKLVVIPKNIESIGMWSFGASFLLKSITVSNPDCLIYDSAYTIDETATIYGYSGSTAQAYAEKYGRTFVALDDTPSETVYGDANCDGDVLVNDAVLVMAYATNSEECAISEQGLLNADVYQSGDGVAVTDAAAIQKYLTKLIASLPES